MNSSNYGLAATTRGRQKEKRLKANVSGKKSIKGGTSVNGRNDVKLQNKAQNKTTKDVFDREKLKTLLKVVSDDVLQVAKPQPSAPIKDSGAVQQKKRLPKDKGQVLDREKFKNLLNVVSDNILLVDKLPQKDNSPECDKSINQNYGMDSAEKIDCPKKRTRGQSSKCEDSLGVDQKKIKKMKITDIGASNDTGQASGVDVNKLKNLLSKVSESNVEKKDSKTTKSNVPLKERMVERLNAARFRYLNEQLYSTTGSEAQAYFTKDRNEFEIYHQGYSNQVKKWPINPVDIIITDILKKQSSLIIADFGCGDAKIARSVPNTVYSYDLVALNEHVVSCDISKVPLNKQSVDVVVCCLSLMGKNLVDYLKEANRVLKLGGELKLAEIESRISNVKSFVRGLKAAGFSLSKQDLDHKMFIFMDFIKKKTCPPNKEINIVLQPCLYKKR